MFQHDASRNRYTAKQPSWIQTCSSGQTSTALSGQLSQSWCRYRQHPANTNISNQHQFNRSRLCISRAVSIICTSAHIRISLDDVHKVHLFLEAVSHHLHVVLMLFDKLIPLSVVHTETTYISLNTRVHTLSAPLLPTQSIHTLLQLQIRCDGERCYVEPAGPLGRRSAPDPSASGWDPDLESQVNTRINLTA